jgi:Zn-finger nucleic acid-binding protein
MTCPRCDVELTTSDPGESLQCPQCSGWFVPASDIRAEALDLATESPEQEQLRCPGDGGVMKTVQLGDAALDVCDQCGGVWLDAGESLDDTDRSSSLSRYLLYTATLPERVVRSSVGLAAGAATEAAGFLVPQAFQSSKTYEIVVRNSPGMLTREIGGVKQTGEAGKDVANEQEDLMARKAVGNFVDLAGLATLHTSPVWMMAIVSDLAYGAGSCVQELAAELQKQGLIDDDATIHNVDDVLTAVKDASGNAASMFDTPPLSVDQLKESLDTTRQALASADIRSILPEAELKKYWDEMKSVATDENVSLLGVSGAVTMGTLNRVKTVGQGTITGVQVVGGLVSRPFIDHYSESLSTICQDGLFETLKDTSAPYVEAVWNNFSDNKGTWTEELLSGRAVMKGFDKLGSWLGRK